MPELPIMAAQIRTARTATCVREISGRADGEPVVLLHGNLGSSVFLFPIMQHLPTRFRPIAVDLRGFGGSDPDPVDATRGMRDFSDDVLAVLDVLGLDSAHLIGWSLGGAVAMQAAIDASARLRTLTLLAPVSPYGFGGTIDAEGALAWPDGAGTGGGMIDAASVAALADGDTSEDGGPRTFLRRRITGPGWDGADEEELLASMIATAIGPDNYPGDSTVSPNPPGFAPGRRGVMNALSPVYCDLSPLTAIDPKPPILWVRGENDRVIYDAPLAPGPRRQGLGQPMLAQTRAVLRRYADGGGLARDVVLPGVGHAPQLEDLPRLMEVVIPHLDGAERGNL